ncbi:MAG: NAD(P) transhydrogenase subunit alpha [Trueperaceae bacterium]|nr:NAD(P) transhydrogenase subunit alpha [Trueperaceae bacterium]
MNPLLLFVFVLAIYLGLELITKVPSQLHTPLMSGSNAISGITIVGAIVASGESGLLATVLGTIAVTAATINVIGGYMVTNRMLGMFKTRKDA